jgi:hypothetical protein
MNKSFFIFLSLAFPSVLLAQEVSLKDFSLPEYRRSELEFNFGSQNNGSHERAKPEEGTEFRNTDNISVGTYSDLYFRRFSNNDTYQGSQYLGLSVAFPGLYSYGNEGAVSSYLYSSKNSSINLNFSSYNRFYRPSQWYVEVNPSVYMNASAFRSLTEYRYDDATDNYDNEVKQDQMTFNTGVEFRYGKGRVEPVEDLRQLVYILDDLQKAGRLKRELSEEEKMELARKLSALKNRRFLDSRLRLIEEMQEIGRLMNELDLLTGNDALAYATINDYWSMAANPSRQSGSRLSVGIDPGYSYFDVKTKNTQVQYSPDTVTSTENHSGRNGYSVYVSARYEMFEPLNLYWQQDYSAEVFTDIFSNRNENRINDSYTSTDLVLYGITGNYSLKYYPNSRSSFSGNSGLSYQQGKGTEFNVTDKEVEYRYLRANLGGGATWYFSPQLTVNGTTGITYTNTFNTTTVYTSTIYPKNQYFQWYLNVSLLYKIF